VEILEPVLAEQPRFSKAVDRNESVIRARHRADVLAIKISVAHLKT